MRFVVLSSSAGSVFQAVIDASKSGALTAECCGLVADREDRGCIEKAKAAGIPVRVVSHVGDESREGFDRRVHEAIVDLFGNDKSDDRFVACMGWMWVMTPFLIKKWKGTMLNVHPALLPKHGGKGMYGKKVHEAVLTAKERESGMTIHVVDEGVDTGRILLQKSCPVLPDDTVESLKRRIQALEKEWYPKVLQMIENGELSL